MKRLGKISITALVIMVFALLGVYLVATAYGIPTDWARPMFGGFTGPANGTEQNDNLKASLDLAHSKLAAQYGCSGSVFFVDSGIDGTAGTSWTTAVGTLDEAVNLCSANAGDLILVAAGHAENLSGADGVDVDKAGITIVGLGHGDLRPTFSYTNANGEFVLGAAGDNSAIYNLKFIATVTTVAHAIDVEAACIGWSIHDCEFVAETTTTDEFVDVITIGAAADNGWIDNCRFLGDPGSNAGPQSCINFIDCDYLRITNCVCFGDRAVACIQNETNPSNHILIKDNTLFNGIIGGNAGLNTEPCIELVATTTGVIQGNYCICNLATKAAAIVAADCYLFENYYNEDESSAGTGGIIGTASDDG
jgi:hypothetical protein